METFFVLVSVPNTQTSEFTDVHCGRVCLVLLQIFLAFISFGMAISARFYYSFLMEHLR